MGIQLQDVLSPQNPVHEVDGCRRLHSAGSVQPSPKSHVNAVFVSADGTRSGPESASDLPISNGHSVISLSIIDVLRAGIPS